MRLATKAPIAKIADKVSGVFVPTVIAIALVTIAVWLLAGESIGFALARGISVLVIEPPVCTWPGDTGGDHGRKRNGCEERHHVQDSGIAGKCRKDGDRSTG